MIHVSCCSAYKYVQVLVRIIRRITLTNFQEYEGTRKHERYESTKATPRRATKCNQSTSARDSQSEVFVVVLRGV